MVQPVLSASAAAWVIDQAQAGLREAGPSARGRLPEVRLTRGPWSASDSTGADQLRPARTPEPWSAPRGSAWAGPLQPVAGRWRHMRSCSPCQTLALAGGLLRGHQDPQDRVDDDLAAGDHQQHQDEQDTGGPGRQPKAPPKPGAYPGDHPALMWPDQSLTAKVLCHGRSPFSLSSAPAWCQVAIRALDAEPQTAPARGDPHVGLGSHNHPPGE